MGFSGRRWLGWTAACGIVAAGAAGRTAALEIGSPAPALDIAHWFESAAGSAPIAAFEPGQVYVVEFWATWCPPCRDSIAHLAETQERLAGRGVTVIGVSDEDVETVAEFLRERSGAATLGDLTRKYRLTTDPDGSVNHDYMEAAGQGGIPTAFIVGRKGEIEWIGHPEEMDEPLAKIVAGTWDRTAHAADFREQREMDARCEEISALEANGQAAAAVGVIDGFIPRVASAARRAELQAMRTQLVIRAGGPRAVEAFGAAVAAAGDSPDALNELAWAVAQLGDEGARPAPQLVAAAAAAAARAAALAPENGSVLDTLAHLQDMQGDVAAALATERQAARHAGEYAPEINAYLEELEKRAAGR